MSQSALEFCIDYSLLSLSVSFSTRRSFYMFTGMCFFTETFKLFCVTVDSPLDLPSCSVYVSCFLTLCVGRNAGFTTAYA